MFNLSSLSYNVVMYYLPFRSTWVYPRLVLEFCRLLFLFLSFLFW